MKNHRVGRTVLWKTVADALRKEILPKTQPGQRLDSESALARRFGVSIVTLREGVLSLIKEGLLERRHGSGVYVVSTAKPRHVALWLTSNKLLPQTSIWSLRILDQVRLRLSEQDVRFKIYWSCSHESWGHCSGVGYEEFLRDLADHAIVAVGLIQGWWGDAAAKLIRQTQVPVVYNTPGTELPAVYNTPGTDPEVLAVGLDYLGTVREGTRRLLQQGCRRIAWIDYRDRETRRTAGSQSNPAQEAFRAVLAEYGVAVCDCWIGGDLHPNWLGAGYEEFREIWLASGEKPDGLLVSDDLLLPDVALAIDELGIAVPSQLKVVALAHKGAVTCPSFPAARFECDPDLVAAATSEMLIKLVRNLPIEQKQVVVPFHWLEAPTAKAESSTPAEFPATTFQKSSTNKA